MHTHTQAFYGPFSATTRVSQCQKRTSGLYGAREDQQRQTHRPSGIAGPHSIRTNQCLPLWTAKWPLNIARLSWSLTTEQPLVLYSSTAHPKFRWQLTTHIQTGSLPPESIHRRPSVTDAAAGCRARRGMKRPEVTSLARTCSAGLSTTPSYSQQLSSTPLRHGTTLLWHTKNLRVLISLTDNINNVQAPTFPIPQARPSTSSSTVQST